MFHMKAAITFYYAHSLRLSMLYTKYSYFVTTINVNTQNTCEQG